MFFMNNTSMSSVHKNKNCRRFFFRCYIFFLKKAAVIKSKK